MPFPRKSAGPPTRPSLDSIRLELLYRRDGFGLRGGQILHGMGDDPISVLPDQLRIEFVIVIRRILNSRRAQMWRTVGFGKNLQSRTQDFLFQIEIRIRS